MPGSADRDRIIADLYNSKDIDNAIGKMQPAEIRDDLKQEMFLALYEAEAGGRLDITSQQNELKWWLIRTMLNMAQSNDSTFAKKFRFTGLVEFKEMLPPGGPRGSIADDFETGTVDGAGPNHAIPFSGTPADTPPDEYHDHLVRVQKAVDDLHFYPRGILHLYAKHGRKAKIVSKETGIPLRSIYQTVKEARETIILKLKKQ